MGASCTVQGWKPIREEDIITKVRYEKPLGDISGVVRVYYKSHLYDDEREYDCVRTFIWGSRAEDYVKFVVPIINTPSAFIKGNRYYAEWVPKKPAKAKKNAAIAEKKSTNAENDDTQLTFLDPVPAQDNEKIILQLFNRVNELTAQRESINAELLTIKAELIKMVSAIDGGEDNEQI